MPLRNARSLDSAAGGCGKRSSEVIGSLAWSGLNFLRVYETLYQVAFPVTFLHLSHIQTSLFVSCPLFPATRAQCNTPTHGQGYTPAVPRVRRSLPIPGLASLPPPLRVSALNPDSEEEMKALEADLLTNMYTSKINRAKLPYWKMTLLNVCNLVNKINNQMGETVEVDEEELVPGRQFPAALDGFSLEAMLTVYQLQKVCHSRAFQHWELLQQDTFDLENSSQEKEIMKRKNPYILKRQLHVNKARRPYILKRSSYY
ncbi:neurotensin/neuromedin N [Cyanistes caeruleus]|nr:neurotensin/neuromedin N [Cyanistes caeruleus]